MSIPYDARAPKTITQGPDVQDLCGLSFWGQRDWGSRVVGSLGSRREPVIHLVDSYWYFLKDWWLGLLGQGSLNPIVPLK